MRTPASRNEIYVVVKTHENSSSEVHSCQGNETKLVDTVAVPLTVLLELPDPENI